MTDASSSSPLEGPVVIAGSGSALTGSPLWCQILADVTGHPVVVDADESSSQATVRGVALLLGAVLRGRWDWDPHCPHAAAVTYQPDAATREAYSVARARHERAYVLLLEG